MGKSAKFEMEGYSIEIHAKNFALSDAIRDYVLEKISRIERFSKDILDIDVVLDVQKLEHSVVMLLKFLHIKIRSQASTDSIYSAIDKATDRLVRLVTKYKSQLQEHHHVNMGTIDLNVNVLEPQRDDLKEINTAIEEENWRRDQALYAIHEVTKTETLRVRMLTQEEAIMNMELSGNHFIIYKSEENQKYKVIYRRGDDSFGLIELPE